MEVFPTLLGQKPQILSDIMTYFLADAVTEYKKLGSLEQQKGLATQFQSLEVRSERCAEALLASPQLASPPGRPWPAAAPRQAPPMS